ncbi:MAG TPA: hypothetical protein VFR97_02275 [Capillimicrobium sp.]|nr:hypothetical protein [Capillimicrobium sp.]
MTLVATERIPAPGVGGGFIEPGETIPEDAGFDLDRLVRVGAAKPADGTDRVCDNCPAREALGALVRVGELETELATVTADRDSWKEQAEALLAQEREAPGTGEPRETPADGSTVTVPTAPAPVNVDLGQKRLLEIAEAEGVDVGSLGKSPAKAKLVEAIEAHRAAAAQG